jgi:hypothetical protein
MTITGSIEAVSFSILLSFPRALYPANRNQRWCFVAKFVSACGCGGSLLDEGTSVFVSWARRTSGSHWSASRLRSQEVQGDRSSRDPSRIALGA